jgi:hypothetical protein
MTLIDDKIYYEHSTGYLYELKEKFGGKYYTPIGKLIDLISNLNITVYLKQDNIMGYTEGTKCKLQEFNGNNYSVIINGKWYGWYSFKCFSFIIVPSNPVDHSEGLLDYHNDFINSLN